jgi:hypothetical protein
MRMKARYKMMVKQCAAAGTGGLLLCGTPASRGAQAIEGKAFQAGGGSLPPAQGDDISAAQRDGLEREPALPAALALGSQFFRLIH